MLASERAVVKSLTAWTLETAEGIEPSDYLRELCWERFILTEVRALSGYYLLLR